MLKKNKTILIFFGPPGSGKGTQAEMISKKFKLPTISTGKLFRFEISVKTKLGKKVEKILEKGKLAPDNITEKLLFKRISKKDAVRGFILDGFPRNKKQLNFILKNFKLDNVRMFAILVDVSDREVKSRLSGRRVCSCGETYHIKFNPPKKSGICDLCGLKLYIRDDDKPSVIAERLKIYHKEIEPILGYWEKSGKLIKIDGEQSISAVHKEVIKSLKSEI